MELTRKLLEEMKIKDPNFSDGVIMPDGDYRLIENEGHLETLMEILKESDSCTEDDIWKRIPEDDSPLFWLIEKTGCVLTDYNSTVGMAMTPAQRSVYHMLVSYGFLTEQYCDLTKQRKKIHEEEKNGQKEEKA
ncbi:MAG: hypothetical protein Q4D55_09995 [Eubacteriales bacterium]|nr:hypothetical protein [Eubacteriales bacterium]